MAQFGSIITNIGLAKISNAQITNSTIGIESMVLGDGNGAYYTVSQSQTALRNEVWRGLLADQRIDANNPNRIEFSAFIPSSVGGFTIREVGLLDTDGNLIALSLYPEQYKPTLGEGISDDILIHFVIETSNASVITLAVDVTNVIATRQYVDRKTEEVNDALTEHLEETGTAELYYRNEVNQTVPNATGMDCVFTHKGHMGKVIDNTEIHTDGRIKVNKPGVYLYVAKAMFLGNPDGTRSLTLTRNGAGLSANVVRASDADVVDVAISQLIQLDAGDIVGMAFYQNSNGSLDVFGGTSQTFLQLYRLGGTE